MQKVAKSARKVDFALELYFDNWFIYKIKQQIQKMMILMIQLKKIQVTGPDISNVYVDKTEKNIYRIKTLFITI